MNIEVKERERQQLKKIKIGEIFRFTGSSDWYIMTHSRRVVNLHNGSTHIRLEETTRVVKPKSHKLLIEE